jgi:hypothetical protein
VTVVDLVAAVGTVVLLCCSMASKPQRAWCLRGYDLRTGVRPTGQFECWPQPVGDPDWDGVYMRPDRSRQPDGVLRGRIWCTNGDRAIVVDERTVGCQR